MGSLQRCIVSVKCIISSEGTAYLDSMTELLTVLALYFGPISGLWAVLGEMALLVAVAASNVVGVTRLITLLCDVVLRTAVATRALGNVGAL
jgi:hypothetical protein